MRIHAIIPPRATELRLLSNSLPLMVRVERVEPVNPAMSNESFPEHRSRDFDDNPKEENDPSIITDERDNPAEDIEFIGGEDGLRRRITTLSLSSRRHLDYEETGPVTIDPSPSRDSANEENYSKEELEVEELPLVPMSEIVDFYQDLMSCMQGIFPFFLPSRVSYVTDNSAFL